MANVLYVVVLTASLAALASASVQRNCGIKTCTDENGYPIPEKHVSCLYKEGLYGHNCSKVLSHGLTEQEKQEILRVHNDFRHKVASGDEERGAPGPQPGSNSIGPLQWDQQLADLAQLLADQCNGDHDQCRDTEDEKVGQNIAWASKSWRPELPADYKSQMSSLTEMITGWFNEVAMFNGLSVEKFYAGGFAHYTQMLWGATKRIGCGFIRYTKKQNEVKQLLICNYGPTGNWINQPVYKPIDVRGRQPTSGSNGPHRIPNHPNRIPV